MMKPTAPPIAPSKRSPVVLADSELSVRACRNLLRVFMGLLLLPFVFEVAAWCGLTTGNLWVSALRSVTQRVLLHTLTEGNRDVRCGRDGWLFAQNEIDRMVRAERADHGLHGSLLELAANLKKQEVGLWLVLIPSRVTLYPEQLRPGTDAEPVRRKEEKSQLAALTAAGAEVMDMTDALWVFRERQPVCYAQDSHWTPEAMKAVALAVNKQVREKFPRLVSTETPIIQATILEHADAGDLARRLDPARPESLLGTEPADLISIRGFDPDAKSPVVVCGGELLRVFDDPALSFGGGAESPHAGFATQLTTLMGHSLDVRGMPQQGDSYEGKKLVICLLPMAELVP